MRTANRPSQSLVLRGFTIVELLVTIGVIAILMGLLISGLRGAMGSARKTRELNGLRGVYAAWYQYANTYDEAILPGFLDTATQNTWKVGYTNASGKSLSPALAQTYPWRLARFLDDPYGTMLGYLESDVTDANDEPCGEWDGGPSHPDWMSGAFGTGGSAMALQPAFGYNAFYFGGWYKNAIPSFADAAWTTATGGNVTGRLVCTRLANISRTSELVVFASSTLRDPGTYRTSSRPEDRIPGCPWITPPQLGTASIWEPYMGSQQSLDATGSAPFNFMHQAGMTDTGILQVNSQQGVPVRRHNGLVAVVRADGATESMSIGTLMNMERWIDAADRPDFSHQDN
jgi:prepilin-type N-terminal cleavage/methylation domain-containing protein